VAVISPMLFFYPLLYQMRFYALTRPRLSVYVATYIKRHVAYTYVATYIKRHVAYTCQTISHSRPFQ
jgi:hypothetical protein